MTTRRIQSGNYIISVENGYLIIESGSGSGSRIVFDTSATTADRTFTFPDTDGTFASTTDIVSTLDELTDVDLTGAADNDLLYRSGGNWVDTGGALTFNGSKLTTSASIAGSAGLNLPHGVAPSAPADGDLWTTTSSIFARINGATIDLAAGGSAGNSFETQTVTDTDSGFTWGATGSAIAESSTDTLTWVSGVGIDLDIDATNDAIRVSSISYLTHAVTDTDSGFTWSDTGSTVAESVGDTLTWVSGAGIELDVDATNDAIRVSSLSYSSITDGSNTATAEISDTFKLRTANGLLTILVTEDDVTHGDNALFTVNEANIDHDALTNYVANEHIDHSTITLTVDGTANEIDVSGTDGNITASRSWTVGIADNPTIPGTSAMTIPTGTTAQQPAASVGLMRWDTDLDTLRFTEGLTPTWRTVVYAGGAFHDGFSDYVINEHVDHSSVSLTAGDGLSGGGDITTSRTFSVNVTNSIEISTDNVQLVGDAASPGNNQYYGTDGTGTKGFHSLGAASYTSWTLQDGDTTTVALTDGETVQFTEGTGDGASIDINFTDVAAPGFSLQFSVTNTDKGSTQNIFKNIAVSGQNTIVADSNNDTLTLAAGTGISITTDDSTDTLTINNSVSNFGTMTVTDTDSGFTWNPTGSVVADSSSDTITLVSGAGINIDVDSASDAIRVTSLAASPSLNDLSDVDITGASTGDIIYKSSGDWLDSAGGLTYDGADFTLTSGQFIVNSSGSPIIQGPNENDLTIITGTGAANLILDVDAASTGTIQVNGPLEVNDTMVFAGPSTLIISGGGVTATQVWHRIDTEASAATDDLDTINGGSVGDILILQTVNDARDVTIKDGIGNILGDGDVILDEVSDKVLLIYDGTNWCVVSSTTTGGGISDHGGLSGLSDNDHPQYARLANDDIFTTEQTIQADAPALKLNANATATARRLLEFKNWNGVSAYDDAYRFILSTGTGNAADLELQYYNSSFKSFLKVDAINESVTVTAPGGFIVDSTGSPVIQGPDGNDLTITTGTGAANLILHVDAASTGSVQINGPTIFGDLVRLSSPNTLTISSGGITITKAWHLVDTEASAATDDLDTINGGLIGAIIVLQAANSARSVVVKDGTGNIRSNGDFTLDHVDDTIMLLYTGSVWCEISRSDNST